MAARGHMPPSYGRSVQVSGMMRHGSFPASHRHGDPFPPPPEVLENKFAVQEAEIEQLAGDNHRLAASHVALRQDLAAAQEEIERLGAHIRSIQTESDIQIRVLMEKISKMEKDIEGGESVKKELQQAHVEAQSLLRAKQELIAQIKQATLELDEARADIKRMPEMHADLDGLRQEHQRLRSTFQHEKSSNMEKVEQMCAMERDLVGMAREVEKLRADVLNAETIAHAPNPYGGPYMNPSPFYPPVAMHDSGGYVDAYGRFHVQMGVGAGGEGLIPYGNDNSAAAATPSDGAAHRSGSTGSFDAAHPR